MHSWARKHASGFGAHRLHSEQGDASALQQRNRRGVADIRRARSARIARRDAPHVR